MAAALGGGSGGALAGSGAVTTCGAGCVAIGGEGVSVFRRHQAKASKATPSMAPMPMARSVPVLLLLV